jgi:hypothetical protein
MKRRCHELHTMSMQQASAVAMSGNCAMTRFWAARLAPADAPTSYTGYIAVVLTKRDGLPVRQDRAVCMFFSNCSLLGPQTFESGANTYRWSCAVAEHFRSSLGFVALL